MHVAKIYMLAYYFSVVKGLLAELVVNGVVLIAHLLWPPYEIGGPLYFCPVVTIFLSFFLSIFFFIPRLISAARDWMSTVLPHMVWP